MSFDEWRDCVEGAMQDPGYRRGMRMLSDRRRLERGYTFTIMEQIVDFFRTHAGELGHTRWAVVVPNENAARSVLAFGQELAKTTIVQVQGFTDLDAALAWLVQVVDDDDLAELRAWVDEGVSPSS
jgi:hypothetical protein